MTPSLLLAASLLTIANLQTQSTSATEAKAVCRQFVQVRLGNDSQPDEIKAQPLPKLEGEWMVDGKVKGPEGPLLFACLLRQGLRWELINFSLWAPQAIKGV
ncbi:hypothetical protein [Aeromonas salmonicida]|uniref:hypothetical protein n=1 Tax=Aeromonas salmonicida TaxID=645 RepID=UPI000F76C018|nr:hypothetical protein [Aeromonas salmonicida]RSM31344.1 hypothetical protein C5B77_10725 [Aeromonas salmonicida]